MTTDPRADVVARQYQRWQYPEPIRDLEAWLANNWQWFDPSHAHRLFWPDRDYRPDLDILVAGCGTNQAAILAYTNPGARVVAIDVSEPSLDHHRALRDKYALKNLELHCLPIEDVATLGRDFDLVISTGVLHHLASPVLGLQALAGCLRADGVAAIMVYARYGRIGVEMLQAAFRDLALRQDEASLAVVKSAIAALPQDHPLQSYLAIAPDLEFDAGLVDTFLHGRDQSFTVADCLDLVAASGLVFQDWFLKSPYYPEVTAGDPFLAAVAELPLPRQWAVMERVHHRNGCHFFTACRPERPHESYRVDFSNAGWLDAVPALRYRCRLEGNTIHRPGWSRALDPLQSDSLALVDGRRTIRDILATAGKGAGCGQAEFEALGRSVFQSLWQSDFLALQLSDKQSTKPDKRAAAKAAKPKTTLAARVTAKLAAMVASTESAGSRVAPNGRPRVCLNMIVRNEAHIIHELIAAVAASIDTWVIVDTGSEDGTPDVIRRLMAERGIPGELHQRAWRNFGHNRTEALALAQGRADYIWVMDADDAIEGDIDFSGLTADAYALRFKDGSTYWRRQVFRDGLPWHYVGVVHEVAICDQPVSEARLEGNYHIVSRRLGARNRDPLKYARDAEVLLAEVNRDPDDARATFYLAQSYRDAGNFAAARQWYERRAAMGGWDEEVYCALYEAAQAMDQLGVPWPEVQSAYLRAWSARPTRAEPLHAIARRHRMEGEHRIGHLFAQQASRIPLPTTDLLFVDASVYEWRARDELAVCASWLGQWDETLEHCEGILARGDLPATDRARIAANRDQARQGRAGGGDPRPALTRRLLGRAVTKGEIRVPAVPAMLDDYVALCERTFAALGVVFSADQSARLREVLAGQLAAAWEASPRSEILITYDSPVGLSVNYHVKAQWSTLGGAYDAWVASREAPYFGIHPDAFVMVAASAVPTPRSCRVLDLGAGTGRNTLALARRGHPVDAVELSSQFAAILRSEAKKEALPVRVLEGDVFATGNDLRGDYGLVVLSEVASDFRSTSELRRVFELAAACLAPGGRFVLNLFLACDGYTPDASARELGQQVYTSIFTREELAAAAAGLPLELVDDVAVLDYEKAHLPADAWPPTGWYVNWVSGLDLFDGPREVSPVELRWVDYRRK